MRKLLLYLLPGSLIACMLTFTALNETRPVGYTKKMHIIFDLGGVLIETKPFTSFWHLGPLTLMVHWLKSGFDQASFLQTFYDTLDTISGTVRNDENIKDYTGNLMPQLMCDWLKGIKTPKEIRKQVITEVKKHPEWFEHATQQKLIINLAQLIFTPSIFTKTLECRNESIALLKELKKEGHHLYVLSNLDKESFKKLAHKYPDLFELFDEVIISGSVHMAKPNGQIFDLYTNHLPASDCIFVDDQKENIAAAAQKGMNTILCPKIKNGAKIVPYLSYVSYQIKHLSLVFPPDFSSIEEPTAQA